MRSELVEKIPNLLIIRPGALGDTLMLLPTLFQLKGRTQVSLVGRRPGIDFVRDHADHVYDMEGAVWSRMFLREPHPDGLPVPEHDLAMVFIRDEEGTIARNLKAYLPGIEIRILPSLPEPGTKRHAARHILECARSAGLDLDPDAGMRLALEKGLLASTSGGNAPGRLVLHPGSGDPAKNHPPALWRDLLSAIIKTLHFGLPRPVILLGPAEEALRAFFVEELGTLNCEVLWSPEKDQLISTLRSASLYVGHDSGITHLAAMLGAPTIALFRSSDPVQWSPLGPRVAVIGEKDFAGDPVRVVLRAAQEMGKRKQEAEGRRKKDKG